VVSSFGGAYLYILFFGGSVQIVFFIFCCVVGYLIFLLYQSRLINALLSGNPGLLQRHKAAQAQRHIGMDSPSSFAKASAGQVGEAILIKSCCFDYGAIIFRNWYYTYSNDIFSLAV